MTSTMRLPNITVTVARQILDPKRAANAPETLDGSTIGGREYEWIRGDVFAAPAGFPQRHESANAVLFCVNDAPWHAALGVLGL